jgi:maltose-binding protein MalE
MREGMKTGRCRPNIPEYPAVSKIFFTAFHSAIRHKASIAEVMKAAAQKANKEVLIPAYPEKANPAK